MSEEKKRFTEEEEKRIQQAVEENLKKAREREIEEEIMNRTLDAQRGKPGYNY